MTHFDILGVAAALERSHVLLSLGFVLLQLLDFLLHLLFHHRFLWHNWRLRYQSEMGAASLVLEGSV